MSGEGSPSDVPSAAFDRYQVLQQSEDERSAGSIGPIFHDEHAPTGHGLVTRRRSANSSAALALTLTAGLVLGAIAGYSAGSARAERVARVSANAPTAAGRDYTDAMVDPPAPGPPARAVPVEPVNRVEGNTRVGGVAAAIPAPRTKPPRAGGMIVVSRPAGATVTINGRRVGATPVTMPAIEAGTHLVRIQRPGYRPWVTRVQVAEGARARVAASLVGGQAKE